MSKQKLALIEGSYPSLMSGGVQAELLANNSSLNSCIPDKIGMWKMWYVSTDGNVQTITDKPTEVTTAFKVEAIKIHEVTGGARVIQRLNDMRSNEFARYGTENGSGGTNFHAWKEIVTSTGNYPNLGAGYLARQNYINALANKGWWKFAEYAIPSSLQNANRLTSAFILFNGINSSTGSVSGTIEFDLYFNTSSGYAIQGIYINNGSIDPNNVCAVVESDKISLYTNLTATYYSYAFSIRSEWTQNGENASGTASEYISFTSSFYGTTAPANAVYAVVRNIASYAESIPAASQTVLGGVKVYTDSEGYLNIDTQ